MPWSPQALWRRGGRRRPRPRGARRRVLWPARPERCWQDDDDRGPRRIERAWRRGRGSARPPLGTRRCGDQAAAGDSAPGNPAQWEADRRGS